VDEQDHEQDSEKDNDLDYKSMPSGLITKTRLGIALAALLFVGIVIAGELVPLGSLFPSNGITRTDVPKYRLHYLNAQTLRETKYMPSDVNVTAKLEQIPYSSVFRASDDNGHFAYYGTNVLGRIEEIEPDINGIMPGLFEGAPPYYSFGARVGKLLALRNDRDTGPLNGIAASDTKNWDFENHPAKIISWGKSAVLYKTGETKPYTCSCYFIEDLEKPVAKPIRAFKNIQSASADRFGKQFFALTEDTAGGDKTIKSKLMGANFDYKEPAIAIFETPIVSETKLYHNAPACAIALLDEQKLRIVDARKGEPIKLHFYRDLFKNVEQMPVPTFSTLPGVPAALFGDKLIDMRSGDIVETLKNHSLGGVFAVDFEKKILYYSTNEIAGKPTPGFMTIHSYDLHNLKFLNESTLWTPKLAEEKEARQDTIANMYLNRGGELVVLTRPLGEDTIPEL